jgi:hypothetical protein
MVLPLHQPYVSDTTYYRVSNGDAFSTGDGYVDGSGVDQYADCNLVHIEIVLCCDITKEEQHSDRRKLSIFEGFVGLLNINGV